MTRKQILYRTAEALMFPAMFLVLMALGGLYQ